MKTIKLLSLSCVLFLCGSACITRELDGGTRHTIFVRTALAPPKEIAGSCAYTSDATALGLFQGVYDLGLRDDYQLTMLMQGTDSTSSSSINGAHVTIRKDDATLSEQDIVATGFVPAGGNGVVSMRVIDTPTTNMLRPTLQTRTVSSDVIVEVEVKGSDPATGAATSAPLFRMPVRVCNGCLVDFSQGNDPLEKPQPNCLKGSASPPARPCTFGQDETVPCRLCFGNTLACDPQTP